MADDGIEAIILPTGQEILRADCVSFRYNPGLGALRFSFIATGFKPVGVDKLTGRVTGISEGEVRVTVVGYRHFRYQNKLYIQDTDVRQPRTYR